MLEKIMIKIFNVKSAERSRMTVLRTKADEKRARNAEIISAPTFSRERTVAEKIARAERRSAEIVPDPEFRGRAYALIFTACNLR